MRVQIDRREFLQRSTRAALGASLLSWTVAEAGESKPARETAALPIVDTHQHLWDVEKLKLPWLQSAEELNRSFVTEDYLEATRGLNVVKAVYMEVAVEPEQQLAEAEGILELCKRADNPTCAAVIGGHPAAEGFRKYISRFKGNPYVKGVRQVLFSSPGLCLTEAFVAGVRLLGELGMSFDLCLPPTQLGDGAELVSRAPDTRFIVDHCGNADPKAFAAPGKAAGKEKAEAGAHDPDRWRRDMERLSRKKNVVCKISGIVARARKDGWTPDDLAPIIRHCLEAFGPDRVMFGSDWPVCTRVATYRQWVEALKAVVRDLKDADRRKLFHDNAVAFYGLS